MKSTAPNAIVTGGGRQRFTQLLKMVARVVRSRRSEKASQHVIALQTPGLIAIVSSPHSWRPIPGAMAYNMSKAAIDQMAKTAATKMCNKRIRVKHDASR